MMCCATLTLDWRANIVARALAVVALIAPLSCAAKINAPPFNSHWYVGNEEYKFKQTSQMVKWEPTHPQVILTHVEEQSISEPGDEVTMKFGWMSDGPDECPEKYFAHQKFCQSEWPCAHRSISCLAGTGDFRIGLFDSNHGKHIEEDGFCKAGRYSDMIKGLEKKPFNVYRGYHFRIFPHISEKAVKYEDKETGVHVPCGFYVKAHDGLFSSLRINRDGNGCFELAPGEWGTLELSVKRIKKKTVELTMAMNGKSFSTTHEWSDEDYKHFNPSKIDTVAIMYPNGRRYYFIEFAEAAKFDGKTSDIFKTKEDRAQAKEEAEEREEKEHQQLLKEEEAEAELKKEQQTSASGAFSLEEGGDE
eukprot:CAMPEP_0118944990 /NCGR_PEP_ID=MMETSP1169-20130426/41408_1 /TAXON_ID=36882 /ORGANISM="Pyramimonas obovata, Strain CCMP722" /LENGTH=361 /DNA_ID=CAMNT_0006890609 /DNA_START=319 /DNA_END=1401 /DNA_ORIENTATION=-